MSDTPNVVTGDLEAPTIDPPGTPAELDAAAARRERTMDLWLAGTEEPGWLAAATTEGAQELLPDVEDPALETQRGTLVSDDFVIDDSAEPAERQIMNMGPQHPSTHGVLRLQLEVEGETIRRVKPIIGYLHTGMEKTGETLTWLQGPTNVTRMDYLSPFHNELAFSLAVEQLLGVTIPDRAKAIRVLMTELNRVASHLLYLATFGMDIGAVSMMIYGWRDRETCLEFFEKVTGLRMNHNYIRPGGVAADLPDGWEDDLEHLLGSVPAASPSTRSCSTRTRSSSTAPRGSGSSPLTSARRTALPAPTPAPPGSSGTCARCSPTRASSSTSSTCRWAFTATCSTATWSGSKR